MVEGIKALRRHAGGGVEEETKNENA